MNKVNSPNKLEVIAQTIDTNSKENSKLLEEKTKNGDTQKAPQATPERTLLKPKISADQLKIGLKATLNRIVSDIYLR